MYVVIPAVHHDGSCNAARSSIHSAAEVSGIHRRRKEHDLRRSAFSTDDDDDDAEAENEDDEAEADTVPVLTKPILQKWQKALLEVRSRVLVSQTQKFKLETHIVDSTGPCAPSGNCSSRSAPPCT